MHILHILRPMLQVMVFFQNLTFSTHILPLLIFFVSTGEEARYGILNYGLLSSAVARQSVGFNGQCKWCDDESKVSTLAFGLDKKSCV